MLQLGGLKIRYHGDTHSSFKTTLNYYSLRANDYSNISCKTHAWRAGYMLQQLAALTTCNYSPTMYAFEIGSVGPRSHSSCRDTTSLVLRDQIRHLNTTVVTLLQTTSR